MSTAQGVGTTSRVAVLIMAKAPVPGQVKTRLEPLVGPTGCARLQAALLASAIDTAHATAPGRTFVALCGSCELPAHVRVFMQHGANLGERMQRAVQEVAARHTGPIVVIGTDAPTLRVDHLQAAAAAVADRADVAFGPALDGGYYLVAVRRPNPHVFAIDPVLWGGSDVLAASLASTGRAGLRTVVLEPLRDLDTPGDAAAFRADPALPAPLADLLGVTEAAR